MKLFGSKGKNQEESAVSRSQYLIQSIVLEENTEIYRLNRIVYIFFIFIFSFLVWCYFTKIPEISTAPGSVVPSGRTHKVQHLDGGIVKNIYVSNSDMVKQGDKLLDLDKTQHISEFNSLNSSKVDLILKLERLDALLNLRDPNFSDYKENYSFLVDTQMKFYQEQIQGYRESNVSTQKKIKNKRAEKINKERQKRYLKKEQLVYRKKYKMYLALSKEGRVPKTELLDASARYTVANNSIAKIDGEIEVINNTIDELLLASMEYRAKWREQLSGEQSEAARQLAITNEQLVDVQAKIRRSSIASPIEGVVKGLTITSINSVLAPGEVLLEIIPVDDELLVEAKLPPEDIGHVSVGLPVDIKVSTFEYQKFGSIAGTIQKVSASTFLNSEGLPYYTVEIKLAQSYVGDIPTANLIIPGMVVQADIRTGEKSILEYILKPLNRGFDGAFTER